MGSCFVALPECGLEIVVDVETRRGGEVSWEFEAVTPDSPPPQTAEGVWLLLHGDLNDLGPTDLDAIEEAAVDYLLAWERDNEQDSQEWEREPQQL